MRMLVILPTYNEDDTIYGAISDHLALDHPVHLLVVDDSSPDQTADAVNTADAPHPKGQVTVLCRPQPAGLRV